MRKIHKTKAPKEFIEFCASMLGVSFKDLSGEPKIALRKRLLEDQGYICCYCGRRIDESNTKIEHIMPQKLFPELSLDFNNMLASCDGGEKDRSEGVKKNKHGLHCDSKKKDQMIPCSPLEDIIESLFVYFADGTVNGAGKGDDMVNILALNTPFLVHQRKAAIDNYGIFPPSNWDDEFMRLSRRKDDGKIIEFCFVLQSYIKLNYLGG